MFIPAKTFIRTFFAIST